MLFLFAMLTHGALLLSDGIFWDDNLIWIAHEKQQWSSVYELLRAVGNPPVIIYYRLLGFLPHSVFAFKLATFVLIFLTAILHYRILTFSGFFSSPQAVAVAGLVLLYPANQATSCVVVSISMFSYLLFLIAVFLVLRGGHRTGGYERVHLLAGAGLFFLSFTFYALLVVYQGFLLWLCVMEYRESGQSFLRSIYSFLKKNWGLVVLPWLFWIIKTTIWTKHERFSNYNSFQDDFNSLVLAAAKFVYIAIFVHLKHAALWLATFTPVWIGISLGAILALSLWLTYSAPRVLDTPLPSSGAKLGRTAVRVGAILLFLVVLPYVAVGAIPTPFGTQSRYAFLVGIPFALLFMGLLQLILASKIRSLELIVWFATIYFCLGFLFAQVGQYAAWQLRAIKDHAIVEVLKEVLPPGDIDFFVVRDSTATYPEIQQWSDWQGIFNSAWGGNQRIALDENYFKQHYGTKRQLIKKDELILRKYYFEPENVNDKTGLLLVDYTRDSPLVHDPVRALWMYYQLKFVHDRAELSQYLKSLLRVQVLNNGS